MTTVAHENHSSIRQTIMRRDKHLNKYPSTIIETSKQENLPKSLFDSSRKLKEVLGVRNKTKAEYLTNFFL